MPEFTWRWAPTAEPSPIDVLHYTLDLYIDLEREFVLGTVELEVAAVEDGLRTVELDADQEMRVVGVVLLWDEGRPHDSATSAAPMAVASDTGCVGTTRVMAHGPRWSTACRSHSAHGCGGRATTALTTRRRSTYGSLPRAR